MRATAHDGGVARHELARSEEEEVAGHDGAGGDVVDVAVVAQTMRDARRGLLERAHGGRRAPLGVALERFAAALHEHDHEPRERLGENHRREDRQRGDHVGGEVAARHPDERPRDQRRAGEDETDEPDDLAVFGRREHVHHAAGEQEGGGECGNDDDAARGQASGHPVRNERDTDHSARRRPGAPGNPCTGREPRTRCRALLLLLRRSWRLPRGRW